MNKIANFFSNVLDPIPMILLVGLFGIYVTPLTFDERIFWLCLFGAMVTVIGFTFFWFMRMGYVFDARLSKANSDLHRDRLGVLWITNALLVVTILTAWMLGRPTPLWNIMVGTTLTLFLATLVTSMYKISFHMIGITSLVTVLVLHYGITWSPVLLLVPLVAWSRRTLNRHTMWQIVFGALLASLSYIVVFLATGRI